MVKAIVSHALRLGLVAAAVAHGPARQASPPPLPVHARLGAATVSILKRAERVEAFRVMSSLEASTQPPGPGRRTFAPDAPRVDGCFLTATAPDLGPAFARRAVALLLDGRAYVTGFPGCGLEPGVVLRVWAGKSYTDAVLCFRCQHVDVVSVDEGVSTGATHCQMSRGGRRAFARLAREAFPGDTSLESL